MAIQLLNCLLTMGNVECVPGLVLMGSRDILRIQLVLICRTNSTATSTRRLHLKQKPLGRTTGQTELSSKLMTLAFSSPGNVSETQLSVCPALLSGIHLVSVKAVAFASLSPGCSLSMEPLPEPV